MTSAHRALLRGLAASAAFGISLGAVAQTGEIPRSAKAGQSFIGVNVGKSRYNTSCGNVSGLTCSGNGTSYSVVAGNMFTRNVGAALSYLNMGRAGRAGGSVRARGLNLSVLGRLPLGDSLSLEGKVGATYGITHVSADENAGIPTGRASGIGLGYGVGLDVHVARGLHGNVGWSQNKFRFVGQGRSNVSNVTLGMNYGF